ncbi:MAG: hypothetical protein HQK72_15895 [Desulfamplus sp.]|nr:hypothetical protein [Desulfamplus sp.]
MQKTLQILINKWKELNPLIQRIVVIVGFIGSVASIYSVCGTSTGISVSQDGNNNNQDINGNQLITGNNNQITYNQFADKTDPPDSKQPEKQSFDLSKKSFKVLILPFFPASHCKDREVRYEETIKNRLLQKNLNLQVIFRKDKEVSTFEEARLVDKNADLILWGDFAEQCNLNESKVCVKYTISEKLKNEHPHISIYNSTGFQPLNNITELSEGYWQENVDYIIYWVLGYEAYNRDANKEAISYFSSLLPK